ncbi:MAG: energy transducer TonB, partial [Methylococcales bacterium]|nr:energy transducer TonB [Methylococcales bacterium]
MGILKALVLIIFLFSNTVFADLQSTSPDNYTEPNFKANYGINPKPVYPPLAIKRGWEGVVYLRVSVSEKGMPFSVVVHK